MIDSNHILLVSQGWEFTEDHPHPGLGHGAIVISIPAECFQEACGGHPTKTAAFAAGSRAPTVALRLLTHQMLRSNGNAHNPLWNDEWIVQAMEEAVGAHSPRRAHSSKLVNRAKEVLHASLAERLSLREVAEQMGVTPIYLTQEFTRTEGMPLYRYQTYLRLNKALLELPYCEDITGLALDLGFSSHSHFTSVFRNTFGITPSAYRGGGALLSRC